MVNVSSLADDRTARARIRDEALRLVAERGPDAVTIRQIAAAAGISPALVIRHYGCKEALLASLDYHVVQTFEALLTSMTEGAEPFEPGALPSLADLIAGALPPDSPIPSYLARLLTTGGPVGAALFQKLHAISRRALEEMVGAGTAAPGDDPDVRAAVLLANDLAVLILRAPLSDLLGTDPLSAEGMRRWGTEVLAIYRDGLTR
ncbi:MAG TPA: TetR/AcrR family transcriptional regulator [Mycobacteriales bacterium]|nr:TetR/AcrR family transcriptional regulator [Mycobacteriales bacterium]